MRLYLHQICRYEFEIFGATITVALEYKNDIGMPGICGYGATKPSSGGIMFVVLAVDISVQ